MIPSQVHAAAAGIEWAVLEAAAGDKPAHLHVSVIPDSCHMPLDLVFLLDGSGSIEMPAYGGAEGYFADKVLMFVKEMGNYFSIGENKTRVGIVTFAGDITQNFRLDT